MPGAGHRGSRGTETSHALQPPVPSCPRLASPQAHTVPLRRSAYPFPAPAVERGRKERPDLELGVCGEHGGDPESIRFFHDSGLDYVSCSPFRLPIARVASAQAAIAAPR